jgi:ribosomal-protein-alanine N-acetyltransferase
MAGVISLARGEGGFGCFALSENAPGEGSGRTPSPLISLYNSADPVKSGLTDVIVRAALPGDLPAIARLQIRCPEAAQWPIGDYAGQSLLVAIGGSAVLGFCAWRQTAPDEAELLNLAVDPDARRRGVASALLNALAAVAQGTLFLEVAETNAPALSLYTRMGWTTSGIRRGYYNKGNVNAIVMKKGSWYSPG